MKPSMRILRRALLICFAGCGLARAGTLVDVSSSLSVSDSTQSGRISRTDISSVWTAAKAFPGTISGTYSFHTFTIPAATIALAPFLQISMDDTNGTLFVSAYDTTYSPGSLGSGYLGDIGYSGNESGFPRFFQVTLPTGHDLVVVVSDVDPSGGGIGKPFRLVVDGFLDTQFTEANGLLLASPNLSGTNMVFNGTNSFAAGTAYVFATTNITSPLFTWTPVWTNTIGGDASFSFTATNVVDRSIPNRFFTVLPQ